MKREGQKKEGKKKERKGGKEGGRKRIMYRVKVLVNKGPQELEG